MCDSAKDDPSLKNKSLIPTKLEDITTEWLNNTVFKEHKIHVESFKILGDAKGSRGYLSSLNRLQLKVQRGQLLLPDENENQTTSEFEELNVIIKAIPSEPQLRSFIINAGYCQCELHMYREVLPKLMDFLDSRGVSKSNRFVHPFCYYGAEKVGETHEDYKFILVLEDLVASKYQLWNGGEGAKKSFDWEHTAVALKQIALFHGSVVAFRKGRNDITFLEEVFPKLSKPDKDDPTILAYVKSGFAAAIDVIHDSPEIPQGLVEHLKFLEENFKEIVEEAVFTVNPDELNVIRHQDLHVNNVMFAHGTTEDGLGRVPVQAKWFDFQGCQEGRPMMDVGFFLILNCLTAYSTTQLDRSLKVYHETFMGVLEEAGIQLPDYTFEQVKKDFRNYRLPSIIHIISGAPVWCCGPNANQVSRDRLRNAIIYAYNSGELEWTKTSTLTTTS